MPNSISKVLRNRKLLKCVEKGNLEEFSKLLAEGRVDVNTQNFLKGETPLHLALRHNRMEMFRALMRHPEIDINVRDKEGHDPLMACVHKVNYGGFVNEFLKHNGNLKIHRICVHGNTTFMTEHNVEDHEGLKLLIGAAMDEPECYPVPFCPSWDRVISVNSPEQYRNLKFSLRFQQGYATKDAAKLYLVCRRDKRLPLELWMRICNLACGIASPFIKQADIDDVSFKNKSAR